MYTIMVIGGGYVGLVTGVCFAQKDNRVVIVENNPEKLALLLQGKVPFYEPGLDALISYGIEQNSLEFVSSIPQGLSYKPDLIFSCVGTPSRPDGSADLAAVWHVAHELGKYITHDCVVINKSTSPVGTAVRMHGLIHEGLLARGCKVSVDIASNPEFLKEGSAIDDFFYPDRVVVGSGSQHALNMLKVLYTPFLKREDQFICMSIRSAELTKYAANAMLAMRISFVNQIALLADKVGADIEEVRRGIGSDARIGSAFLKAGLGYGGSCFPKDVKALVSMGVEHGQPMSLLHEVDRVNDQQKEWFVNQISQHYGYDLEGKTFGLWGLAFKPNTDDVRSAPSLYIISALLKLGARVVAYDPVAAEQTRAIFGNTIEYVAHPVHVLSRVDALAILTEWEEFSHYKAIDFLALKDKIVFDGRNCFDPIAMQQAGIAYVSVGRNSVTASSVSMPLCKANSENCVSGM